MKIWSLIILAVSILLGVPTLSLGVTATDLEKAKEAEMRSIHLTCETSYLLKSYIRPAS